MNAAVTVRDFSRGKFESVDLQALVDALGEEIKSVHGGSLERPEALLIAQAHTLDAIFSFCARRAAANFGEYLNAAETYLRLGLKAQSQCRATLETLAAMKNPSPALFVKQANIAGGHQQVNNGTTLARDSAEVTPARAEKVIPPNELLEARHGERMDPGAAAAAGAIDREMAAVGAINGTQEHGR